MPAGTRSSTSTRAAALAALERTPPGERPQLYGDGRAGERVAEAVRALGAGAPAPA